jgi:hypothetical protein
VNIKRRKNNWVDFFGVLLRATLENERAMKNAHELNNHSDMVVFCCLSNFATASFSQNDALQVKRIKTLTFNIVHW